ncbi:putative tail fiber protein [Morganella phage vB_MmoP_Lilpapawes]|uniref:Tail fiber protein n=1 Tax=Morganella phage vB_MmoP_Lilpapawes TaxID=2894803 RepID=A0AAE8YQG9_9CAUD|nr:putative tail fiber protein [Morganella phage vB_MmoP_Lilpapawes]
MANVIKTVITYPLNGSTRDFQIPFEYLARKFVQVTLIGRDRKALVNIQDYRFTSKTQITTNKTWGVGDGYELIELRRFTSATDRLVDFADGSILRAYDLNVSQIQTLHVAEEARDLTADTIGVNNEGHLDARGRRIVNVADPVNALDAVNLKTIKEWNDGAYQSYVKAKAEAEKAARSAAAAKTSETTSYSHMTQAGISEQRAKASEVAAAGSQSAAANSAANAANSAGSASSSAQQATDAKDYTKQQADRSYNEAERAKDYADSMGNAIDIGEVITSIDTSTGHVDWKGSHNYKETKGALTYSEWASPNGYQKAWLGAYDDGKVLLSAFHSGYGWSNIRIPTGESGYMATQEWVNTRVQWYANETTVISPDADKIRFVTTPVHAGFYSNEQGWRLLVPEDKNRAIMAVTPHVEIRSPGGYSGVKLIGSGGWHAILETEGRGVGTTYLVTRDAQGQNMYQVVFPQETYGVLATQQWVSANFSNGTKLGPVVTGNYAPLGTTRDNTLALDGFKSIMSQVPSNAVFCGVTFGTSGGFTTGAPKWRVITG